MKWIVLLLTGLIGCSLFSPEQAKSHRVQPMGVTGIQVLNKAEDRIVFQTAVILPTPCWHFKDVEISRGGNLISIKPLYEADPVSICPQVIAYDTITVPVLQLSPGDHRFQFWPNYESQIDTTIHLP